MISKGAIKKYTTKNASVMCPGPSKNYSSSLERRLANTIHMTAFNIFICMTGLQKLINLPLNFFVVYCSGYQQNNN